MKRLTFLFSLLLALAINVFAEGEVTYKKVTSQNEIVDGGVYVLVCNSNGTYKYANGHESYSFTSSSFTTGDVLTVTNAKEITLEKVSSENFYYIKCADKYLGATSGSTYLTLQDKSANLIFKWVITIENNTYYATIRAKGFDQRRIRFSSSKFSNLTDGTDIYLYKKYTPAPTPVVTFGETNYATLCHDQGMDFNDSGVSAYTASLSGNVVNLTEVHKVPASEAVILIKKEDADEVNIKNAMLTDSEKEEYNAKSNILKGVTTAGGLTVGEENRYYALCEVDGEAAFCPIAAGVVIPKGKAYIDVGENTSGPAKFSIQLSIPTSAPTPSKAAPATGQTYDLSGKQIIGTQRGIVIKDGRKHLTR